MSDVEGTELFDQNEITEQVDDEIKVDMIDSLKQILEDMRMNETKYSLMEQLREDYGEMYILFI